MASEKKPINYAEWAIQQLTKYLLYYRDYKDVVSSYAKDFYLFDEENMISEHAYAIIDSEINSRDNISRMAIGKYPILSTKISSQNRVFNCQSTETDSSYKITIEIENNNNNGKPRRRGTKVREVLTFDKRKQRYTKEVFINMDEDEKLIPSMYREISAINDNDIEDEYARVEDIQETEMEFSEDQINLIKKVFATTQDNKHLPVLVTSLIKGLVYKHFVGIEPNGDFFAEECKWRNNTLYFDYQHKDAPGFNTENPIYEIIIKVTSDGTEISFIDSSRTVFSYSSYEQFIEDLETNMNTANYLDIVKARVQKLQELGIPYNNGKSKENRQYVKEPIKKPS